MTGAAPPDIGAEPAYRAQLHGHAAMLLFAILISGSFSLGSRAAPHIDPSALTALRFAIAAAVLAAALVIGARMGGVARGAAAFAGLGRASWRFLVLGALYGVYFVLMFEALRLAPPAPLSAVFTLTPLMTAGFALLLAGQRAAPSLVLVLMIGACGAVWVIFDGKAADILSMNVGMGEVVFFVGAVAHALYAALAKKLQRGETLLAFAFGLISGALLVVAAVGARAVFATDWLALPAIVWVAAVYLAVCATAATASLLQFAAQRLPASKVMAYTYLVPALVILNEGASGRGWPPAEVWPGVALILATLLILLRDERLVGRPSRSVATVAEE